MDRRTALKKSGMLIGAGLTLSTSTTLLQSCLDDKGRVTEWTPLFLNPEDVALIDRATNFILPDEEIPLEVKAFVPRYIDMDLMEYAPKETQKAFKTGLEAFNTACKKAYQKDFVACNEQEQLSFLKKEEEAFVKSQSFLPTFYGGLKKYIFTALFQTEFGIKQYMDYKVLPGSYEGCVALDEVEKLQYEAFKFAL